MDIPRLKRLRPVDGDALEDTAIALCKEFPSNRVQADAMPEGIQWYTKCFPQQKYER